LQIIKTGAATQAGALDAPFGFRHAMLRQLQLSGDRPVAMIPVSCQKQIRP
jgi:hypothetical protein